MESSGDSKNTIYVDSAAVRRIIGEKNYLNYVLRFVVIYKFAYAMKEFRRYAPYYEHRVGKSIYSGFCKMYIRKKNF